MNLVPCAYANPLGTPSAATPVLMKNTDTGKAVSVIAVASAVLASLFLKPVMISLLLLLF